jgi:hypothetical protein
VCSAVCCAALRCVRFCVVLAGMPWIAGAEGDAAAGQRAARRLFLLQPLLRLLGPRGANCCRAWSMTTS